MREVKEGDRAHSRGRPQEEHPDGPPLFVRVLGTSLRPGGTQGGITHPWVTPAHARHTASWINLPVLTSATDRELGRTAMDIASDQSGGAEQQWGVIGFEMLEVGHWQSPLQISLLLLRSLQNLVFNFAGSQSLVQKIMVQCHTEMPLVFPLS